MSDQEDLGPSSSADEGGAAQAAGTRRSTRATSAAVKEKLPSEAFVERSVSPEREEEDNEDKPPPRPPPAPRTAEETEKERQTIRSMWELASTFDFLHLFNEPYLKLPVEFTADELEIQLLFPTVGNVLKDIHIGLLKHCYPPSRPPVDRNTWATVLTKKLHNAWSKLATGECPLHPAQGQEQSVYEHLSPADRVRVLKALCELRLDQEDIHNFVEGSLKDGVTIEAFRLRSIGKDASGWIYWLPQPDGGDFVHRLYRESPTTMGKGKRGIGRRAPVPTSGTWETLATTLPEFREVSERLLESRHKADIRIGRHINQTVVPNLEELERKREKALKRQQRQAMQLHASWNGPGLAVGRSRRERKVVNYTFDDYDRSINDAIKVTRRPRSALGDAPGSSHRDLDRSGAADQPAPDEHAANENAPPQHDEPEERNGHAEAGPPNGNTEEEPPAPAATNLRSGRTSRKPPRLAENVVTDYDAFPDSDEEDESMASDEIAGEVEYTEEYEAARRKRKRKGSDDDEEYRGDESDPEDDIEEDGKEDDDDAFDPSDEDEEKDRKGSRKRSRTGAKAAAVDRSAPQWGTRRSSRSSKSHIDYKQLDGGSEEEVPSGGEDEPVGIGRAAGQKRRGGRRAAPTLAFAEDKDEGGGEEEGAGDPDFEEEEADEPEDDEGDEDGHGRPGRRRRGGDDWVPGQASGRGGRGSRSRHVASGGGGSLDANKRQHKEEGEGVEGATSGTNRRQKHGSLLDLNDAATAGREAGSGGEEAAGGVNQRGRGGGRRQEYSEDDGEHYFSNGDEVRQGQEWEDDHGSDEG